ncbi:MAG: ABC transporter substrate-binding protein [Bacteroidaceae bacterium]|nr:ABC transporter substrate-binding protein [Bacteroidaceae bacterium]
MKAGGFLTMAMALCMAVSVKAQEKMTLMPAWMPQSQFAGYYVALEKGFYADENIDLTIEHMGVNSSKPGIERIGSGEVDIIISHPIQALMARDYGLKVKNVLQVTQNTGIMIVSHKKLDGPQSLNGQSIGRWKSGFSEICEICCLNNNLDVKWVPFLNGINLFMSGAIDATVVMKYNEYYSLVEAMGSIDPENVLWFADCGYDIPEDGLYVTEEYLAGHRDLVERFCRASMKGWNYCVEHKEECVDIVMDYMEKVGVKTNRYHQTVMLDGMIELLRNRETGRIDYASIPQDKYDKLVRDLLKAHYIETPVSYSEFSK